MLTFRLLSSTCVYGQTRSINSFLPISFPGRSTSAISVSSARLPRRSGLSPSSSMRWRGKSRKEPKTIAFSVVDNLPTLAQVILRCVPFCNRLTRSVGKIDQDIQHPTAEEKHQAVGPEHPLANRKFERAEFQLPMNPGARHVSAKMTDSRLCLPSVDKRSNCTRVKLATTKFVALLNLGIAQSPSTRRVELTCSMPDSH